MSHDPLRRIIEEEVCRILKSVASSSEGDTPHGDSGDGTNPGADPSQPRQEAEPQVARWLRDVHQTPSPKVPSYSKPGSASRRRRGEAEFAHHATTIKDHHIQRPANLDTLRRLLSASPSRLGVGRAGTRYLTSVYLNMRADHAVAKDAVHSEVGDDFATRLGLLPLRTLCTDRQEYLLHPARGRRLQEESLTLLQQQGTCGADVQIIIGDGLSAWAVELNGPDLLRHLTAALGAAGFSVGRPLFVRFARVGVQDQIGVTLGSRSTVILVGERPGLGTGDSLSVYLAYNPKLDQDNAEKNCISNVRPNGISPEEAALEAVSILQRSFAAQKGGVALG